MGDRGRRGSRAGRSCAGGGRAGGSSSGGSLSRGRPGRWVRRRITLVREGADAGMATVEYAIVTVAAAAFAGLLLLILRSDEVRELLFGIVRGALST